MQHDSMRVSKLGHAWRIGGFLLWMGTAYIQSFVSRDSTTASSNAFTENNNDKTEERSISHAELKYQSPLLYQAVADEN